MAVSAHFHPDDLKQGKVNISITIGYREEFRGVVTNTEVAASVRPRVSGPCEGEGSVSAVDGAQVANTCTV